MDFNKELIQLKTKRSTILQQISEKSDIVQNESDHLEALIKARWVLTEVSRQTQEHLKHNIEQLVTMCLNEVFPERDFKFITEFQIKRNKMECEFRVDVDGNEYSPKDDMGGSILDIISFALRIILWSLENPKSRNTIILDEPFRFSGRLITKSVQMVKELSKKLNIQFIINTHSDEVIDIADRSFHIINKNGISQIV